MYSNRKGIILAGGVGSRLYPITASISKQLLPVYDKPMVYYPLTTLMLTGIRDILVICSPKDCESFRTLLGDGSRLGLNIEIRSQDHPNGIGEAFLIGYDFIAGRHCSLILGDNIFYGQNFSGFLSKADKNIEGCSIFGYPVMNPSQFGVVEFDQQGNVLSLEEKPERPRSNYAVPGLYFYDSNVGEIAKDIKPSKRGELEVTDINKVYLGDRKLKVFGLGRGIAWMDAGTPKSLKDAGNFIAAIQDRQGMYVACPEEVALYMKFIDNREFERNIESMPHGEYRDYLVKICRS